MRLKALGLLLILVFLNICTYCILHHPVGQIDKAKIAADKHIQEVEGENDRVVRINQTARNVNLILADIDLAARREEDLHIGIVRDFLLTHASLQSQDFQIVAARYRETYDAFFRNLDEVDELMKQETGPRGVSEEVYLRRLSLLEIDLLAIDKLLASELLYLENAETALIYDHGLINIATPELKRQIYIFAYREP